MIYVTGDCHGDFKRFGRKHRSFNFTSNDYIIVCGDFGLCWAKNKEFNFNCKNFAQRSETVLWVQGNHENYDMIAEYPLEEWHGGLVRHIVRDKVILLERGQVFTIDGVSIFSFGGAASHDISDGILDKDDYVDEIDYLQARYNFMRYKTYWREKGVSWWEQELPTPEEIDIGLKALNNVNNRVDYIITHCCSSEIEEILGIKDHNILTDFFNYIDKFVDFKHWYFGHYHFDSNIDKKHSCLYYNVVPLGSLDISI